MSITIAGGSRDDRLGGAVVRPRPVDVERQQAAGLAAPDEWEAGGGAAFALVAAATRPIPASIAAIMNVLGKVRFLRIISLFLCAGSSDDRLEWPVVDLGLRARTWTGHRELSSIAA
jgi:hypothetical protein